MNSPRFSSVSLVPVSRIVTSFGTEPQLFYLRAHTNDDSGHRGQPVGAIAIRMEEGGKYVRVAASAVGEKARFRRNPARAKTLGRMRSRRESILFEVGVFANITTRRLVTQFFGFDMDRRDYQVDWPLADTCKAALMKRLADDESSESPEVITAPLPREEAESAYA